MATSSAPCRSVSKKKETTLMDIDNKDLTEILLRLPAAKDLVRASAACVTIRRLVVDTDGYFLRRFRRLDDPSSLLAFHDRDAFGHALPPRHYALADALADAADFSFCFLPNRRQWHVADICDGRVLLRREGKQSQVFMELAVCDPLHKKYLLLPPVPDDLAASVVHLDNIEEHRWYQDFLAPLDEEAETVFGVIRMAHFSTRLVALVFRSSIGQWQPAASKKWSDLFFECGESRMLSPIDFYLEFHKRHYAYGCFYWESSEIQRKELLVLDTRRMKFSISDIPPRDWCMQGLAIVEAGEDRLGLFGIVQTTLDEETLAGKYYLCCYFKGNKGVSSSRWQLEKMVSLGSSMGEPAIKAATGRYLVLQKSGASRSVGSTPPTPHLDYIPVDVKTMQLGRTVCTRPVSFHRARMWIYTNFPLSLSSPTI